MKWSQVNFALREEMLKVYEGDESLLPYAEALGMNLETLERRLREHREYLRAIFEQHRQKVSEVKVENRQQNDIAQLCQELSDARDQLGVVPIMHFCDVHFPWQNDAALDITYQLVRHVQPRFMVVGSDTSDFSVLSKFQADPDAVENGDILDAFREHWYGHINRILKESPNTSLIYILGNHELRIYDFILRQAPAIRKTVWREFVEIARCGGAVKWIGDVDSVRLGPLLVLHGNRTNLHAAKSLIEDAGGQVSVMAGHVHRLTSWDLHGEEYVVRGITSGCIERFPAPYQRRRRPCRKWQYGTAIADVNLRTRAVDFTNLQYFESQESVYVRYERRTFDAPLPPPADNDMLLYA